MSGSAATESTNRLIRFVDRFMPREALAADENKKRQVRSAIGFLMASWAMGLSFALSNLRHGFMMLAYFELAACTIISICLVMIRRTGRIETFGNIGMLSGLGCVWIANWTGGGLLAPGTMMLLTAPPFAYLGYGRRSAIIWSWLSLAGILVMFLGEKFHFLPTPTFDPLQAGTKRFFATAMAIAFVYVAASLFSDIKDYALDMLQRRTEELREANQRVGELFDNMRQGVLAFDGEGRIEGPSSAQAHRIFGDSQLTGRNVADLLFGDDISLAAERDNFGLWLEAAYGTEVSHWEELSEMAPNKVVRNGGASDEQHLLVEFRPVATQDGALRRVMLLVTDETERVKMERAAKARDDAHRREVHELRRLVAGGAHLLLRFLETARSRFAEVSESMRLDAGGTVPQETDVAVAFQHVHTVRGEARTFQLTSLENLCSKMEDSLAPLRAVGSARRASDDAFRTAMKSDVMRALELLGDAERHLIELSPIGEAVLDQITVQKSHLEEAVQLAQEGGAIKGSPLARAMEKLAARPFGESTQQLVDAVPLWAKRESKRVVLELEGRDALVPRKVSRVLGAALTHLVRNSIAHGVELPHEREEAGKPGEATVRLSAGMSGEALVITVEDDGRGIDEEKVRRQAERLGVRADRPLEDLLFEPGLSTSSDVTEIAGRGMGMSAVRRDLATVGYQVKVQSKKGSGTRIDLVPLTGSDHSERPLSRRSA
jgi:two-component system chemotaxis sensor kinase CheA